MGPMGSASPLSTSKHLSFTWRHRSQHRKHFGLETRNTVKHSHVPLNRKGGLALGHLGRIKAAQNLTIKKCILSQQNLFVDLLL